MSTAGLHSLHLSLSLAIVATLAEFFSCVAVSRFLKHLQWQFLELRQQVLRGARADGCSCPDTTCLWDLTAALKPQQQSGSLVCLIKAFAAKKAHLASTGRKLMSPRT